MLSVELALALRAAGLAWDPAPGDHFVLPHRGMDEEVFVLSDMTVDVHDYPTGRILGFNGTTEWALDSVEADDALWLPAEGQLRVLLGGLFRGLSREPADADRPGAGYVVTIGTPSGERRFSHPDAHEAYGQALLDVLQGLRD